MARQSNLRLTVLRQSAHDMPVIEVTPSQAKQLDLLRTKYDIKLIVGFGSKVRGNVHQSSDLDVGVLFNRGTLTMKCLQSGGSLSFGGS